MEVIKDTENRVYCNNITGIYEKQFSITFYFPSGLQKSLLQLLKITLFTLFKNFKNYIICPVIFELSGLHIFSL